MLKAALPNIEVWAELPLLSEGKQGRAINGGQFLPKNQGDLSLDLVVHTADNLLYGVEVCGKQNSSTDGKKRARKKEKVAHRLGLPICWLWMHKQTKWQSQIDEMKKFLML